MDKTTLKKNVTTIEAMAIVVGMIIGSGIFLKPGIVLRNSGSFGMSILAWVAGGIITLASALTIAEIASVISKSGGLYTYLGELYGEKVGFLLGWVQSIISYPASVAAQSIAFATYSNFFIPMNPMQQKMLAIGILAFILVMNIISTKCGGIIQTIATVGKLIPVIAIVVFGILSNSVQGFSAIPAAVQGAGFGAAILGTLWAYDGWIGITNMSEELKNPKRLPQVISLGVVFVIVVYALFNFAIFKVLPYDVIVNSATPGADAADALFGKSGGAFITAGIMVSVFGALNGYLMTAARVPQAMGARKQFPFGEALGKVNPKLRTPVNALAFQAVLAVIYILSGTFETLTDLLIFVLWIFFVMGVFGIFKLRKKFQNQAEGGYKVPLYPITPIVGIIGGAYILISTILSSPLRSFIGIAITLLGIPVYNYMVNKNKEI